MRETLESFFFTKLVLAFLIFSGPSAGANKVNKVIVNAIYAPISARVSPRTESYATGEIELRSRATEVLASHLSPLGSINVLGLSANSGCAAHVTDEQKGLIQTILAASANSARTELAQYESLRGIGLRADFVLVAADCAYRIIGRLPKTDEGAWHLRFYVPKGVQLDHSDGFRQWIAQVMDILVHEGLHLESQLARVRRDIFLEELLAYWRGLCVQVRNGSFPKFPANGPIASYGPSEEMLAMVNKDLMGFAPSAAAYFITGRLWIYSFAEQEGSQWNKERLAQFCKTTPGSQLFRGVDRVEGFEQFLEIYRDAVGRQLGDE